MLENISLLPDGRALYVIESGLSSSGDCPLRSLSYRSGEEPVKRGLDERTILQKIEDELRRLDARGVVVAAEPNLPEGWVRVCDDATNDDATNAYGDGESILFDLETTDYDPDETIIVRKDALCDNPGCKDWHGDEISFDSPHAHGHAEFGLAIAREENKGYYAVWDALSHYSDKPPTSFSDWTDAGRKLARLERLEDGTTNQEPLTAISIRTNGGTRWACGPHGVFEDALRAAFRYDGLYKSREEAMSRWEELREE